MCDYVREFCGDPDIVSLMRRVVQHCPPRDMVAEAQAIYDWVLDHTRFVQDPVELEVIATPHRMLREIVGEGMTSGDCDELATLLCTCLAAVGIECAFRFGGNEEEGIHHVWSQAMIDGNVYDMDPSVRTPFGDHYPFEIYESGEIFSS